MFSHIDYFFSTTHHVNSILIEAYTFVPIDFRGSTTPVPQFLLSVYTSKDF